MKKSLFTNQIIPLVLAIVIFTVLSAVLYLTIVTLNLLPLSEKVILKLRPTDILVGITIYLKTAVDFAVFMGRLMGTNPGWKNRIAIEAGTATGNLVGTITVLIIWTIFKEIKILLAAMVFLASLVLLELAAGGLDHFSDWKKASDVKKYLYLCIKRFSDLALNVVSPILSKIMPNIVESIRTAKKFSWKNLLLFSFTIPFILGLDDFAGYVPLFNVVNVFGFGIGILFGHTLLNLALFISPMRTVIVVRNAWISFLGSLAFILLAFWGFYEAVRIFF